MATSETVWPYLLGINFRIKLNLLCFQNQLCSPREVFVSMHACRLSASVPIRYKNLYNPHKIRGIFKILLKIQAGYFWFMNSWWNWLYDNSRTKNNIDMKSQSCISFPDRIRYDLLYFWKRIQKSKTELIYYYVQNMH